MTDAPPPPPAPLTGESLAHAAARLREAVAPPRAEEAPTISDDEIRRKVDLADVPAPSIGGIRRREG